MAEVTRGSFSTECPKCGSSDIRPLTQRNNFDDQPSAATIAAHVSTSREYECQACRHRWAETVPHPR